MNDSIYLDNAATSFPKPSEVAEATVQFINELGISHDRSVSNSGSIIHNKLKDLRNNLSKLLGIPSPWFHFPFSATDGLNLILSGLIHNTWRTKRLPNGQTLKGKIHVVTTVTEHNSVLRPLYYWKEFGWIELTLLECSETGRVDPDSLSNALNDQTALFVLNHASNVTGQIQDAEKFGTICQQKGVFFLLDASQTAGSIPFSASETGCHGIVFPGHKSLLGPMGTGVMAIDPAWEPFIDPIRLGGTGTQSHLPEMPTEPRVKWTAGHQNLPGLFGLAEGVGLIRKQDLLSAYEKSWTLTKLLADRIASLDGFQILGPWASKDHALLDSIPVLSVAHQWMQPSELAAAILEAKNVISRSGFHCAPLIHRFLGTSDGGTLRFSPGIFSTEPDVLVAVESLEMVTRF